MAIDIFKDELIPMNDVPALLPKPVTATTLQHWWKYGRRGVRLETVKIATVRYTTKEALAEFVRKRTEAEAHHEPKAEPRSDERRQDLERAGLL